MCPEEKNISMSYQGCEMAVKWYFKKIQKKPPEVQKQSPEVFCKKRYSKKFRKLHGKTPVLKSFLNKIASLQPATFLKRDSNASAFL